MNPVQKALWYVESHSRIGITLDDVASASGVSSYYLTRAFSEVFGTSLMRYTRRRRLTEAAKQLVGGASDILTLAIDNGYGSHEAFSRAFKEEFGTTPESVRMLGTLSNLKLTEPIVMKTSPLPALDQPRIESLPTQWLVGLVERYDCKSRLVSPINGNGFCRTSATYPAKWARMPLASATTLRMMASSTI